MTQERALIFLVVVALLVQAFASGAQLWQLERLTRAAHEPKQPISLNIPQPLSILTAPATTAPLRIELSRDIFDEQRWPKFRYKDDTGQQTNTPPVVVSLHRLVMAAESLADTSTTTHTTSPRRAAERKLR